MRAVQRLVTGNGALRAWWAVSMGLVATFAAVGLSIAYTAYTQTRSDRQWCALLEPLDQPLPSSPAVTVRQRYIAQQIHRLRILKGC